MRPVAVAIAVVLGVGAITHSPQVARGQGVGAASWTPSESSTSASPSRFLSPNDSFVFRTDAVWDGDQSDGLNAYVGSGLRYTYEINDRSGRLSATGYWATNHPDPAFDRDDDDGDGRWEEAEIIAGTQPPEPGRTYTSLVQFSRWHGKRQKGSCDWAWDRRMGTMDVLSQLSRDLLGEWQAERYTTTYDTESYPRVGARPRLSDGVPPARCRDVRAGEGQTGLVITFAEPQSWAEFTSSREGGRGKWTAFEAIGRVPDDDRIWTCGGPATAELGLDPCTSLGVDVTGVVAGVGYFDDAAADTLRANPSVAAVDNLRDTLTGLLFDVGGFGVVRPGLTVNDRYWENDLAD